MRCVTFLVSLGLSLVTTGMLRATGEPVRDAIVSVPEVQVRCRPSTQLYATSMLHQGERVGVIGEQDGWLAITPPPGSFSWVDGRYLQKTGPNSAVVSEDNVEVRVGSALHNVPPLVWQVKAARGTQLIVIGQPLANEDGSWWPVLPPPAEVRYIPATAVKSVPLIQASTVPLTTANPGASVQTASLQSQSGTPTTPALPASRASQPAAPAPFSPPQPPPSVALQSSGPGRLRRAAFYLDNKPTYALETAQGQLRLYVTAQPGLNLEPFVNRGVELSGIISYHGLLKTNHMIAYQASPLAN